MSITQIIATIILFTLLAGALAFLFVGDYITSIPKRWRLMRAYGASRRKAFQAITGYHWRGVGVVVRFEPFNWRLRPQKIGDYSYYLYLGPLVFGVYI